MHPDRPVQFAPSVPDRNRPRRLLVPGHSRSATGRRGFARRAGWGRKIAPLAKVLPEEAPPWGKLLSSHIPTRERVKPVEEFASGAFPPPAGAGSVTGAGCGSDVPPTILWQGITTDHLRTGPDFGKSMVSKRFPPFVQYGFGRKGVRTQHFFQSRSAPVQPPSGAIGLPIVGSVSPGYPEA